MSPPCRTTRATRQEPARPPVAQVADRTKSNSAACENIGLCGNVPAAAGSEKPWDNSRAVSLRVLSPIMERIQPRILSAAKYHRVWLDCATRFRNLAIGLRLHYTS